MEVLQNFIGIGLDAVADKSLQDRIDRKYLASSHYLNEILHAAIEDYDVLEINGQRNMHYQTIYYDNEDFMLYHHARVKRPNRFKIRHRKYYVNQLEFFELKEKVKDTYTIKYRAGLDDIDHSQAVISDFLWEHNLDFGNYTPSLDVRYDRVCLISRSTTERITIDTNLQIKNDKRNFSFDKLVIVEVKSNKLSSKNPVTTYLKSIDNHPISCSKYCIGLSYIKDDISRAGFAPQIRLINNILK